MSSHVTELRKEKRLYPSSSEVAQAIAAADFSGACATLVGYGKMGKQYLKALEVLRVASIRVVGRSAETLAPLRESDFIKIHEGGFETFEARPLPDELAIVALPTTLLLPAARHLLSLGFRKVLIEKPISLYSNEIETLAQLFEEKGALGVCAYNRVAYPSFLECRSRLAREGGATSCTYAFTEMISSDWEWIFPPEELARWGVSNSLHPIGMAHCLIGLPKEWSGTRAGSLSWHPSGSVFVGAGVSHEGVPFSYHADWGSTCRWGVEVHSPFSSYRLMPLEKLFRRVDSRGEWVEVPVQTFAPQVKAGIVEEVAAIFSPEIRSLIGLVTLSEAAALARFAEEIFGYER